jgi:hypothetical protein
MKRSLMATAAALALIAGPALAQKQQAPAEKAEAPARAPAAQQQAPAEKIAPGMNAGAKSETEARGGASANGSKAEGRTGAQSETTGQAGRDGQPAPRAAQPPRGQGSEGRTTDGQPRGQQGAQSSDQSSSPSATEGARAGAGANVNLTTEQKTKIRSTVIQSASAPKVANVNFSLTVGTVVPRTVNVVAVPPVLVEIHPQWRGYRYFVVGERVVIVEPKSLKIVAVLVV